MKGSSFPEIDFQKLIVPPAEIKIDRRNGVYKVYDRIRKDYFCLTPEEFVRQIFVEWLINHLGYPQSLLANEIGIHLNGTLKRCDTVLFSPEGEPIMIIEYKAPNIKLDQEVFNQIVRYNMALKARYLVVCNGYSNYICRVDYKDNKIEMLACMPEYKELDR